jgi:hypothetical protein
MNRKDFGATWNDSADTRYLRNEKRTNAFRVAKLFALLGTGALFSGLWIVAAIAFGIAAVIGIINW